MPIPCQGFTFTWGGDTLSEVQSLDLNQTRALPIGRTVVWTTNAGDVTLFGFSITNIPNSEYGRRRRLIVLSPAGTAGGSLTLFDSDCIYQNTKVAAVVNGVVTFGHVFKVMDTQGAPSNP